MGHYVFSEGRKFFIEDGKVYNIPGGQVLPLNPETFEPLEKSLATGKAEAVQADIEEEVAEAFKEEVSEEPKTKKLEHLRSCTSGGRGGRYTDGCPKCDYFKNKGK